MIAVDYATDCSMVWVLETSKGNGNMGEIAAFLRAQDAYFKANAGRAVPAPRPVIIGSKVSCCNLHGDVVAQDCEHPGNWLVKWQTGKIVSRPARDLFVKPS